MRCKRILAAIGVGILVGLSTIPVYAIPSAYDRPNFSDPNSYNPQNGNFTNGVDIGVQTLPYGLCGNVINTRHNVASCVSDLNAICPGGSKHSLGIITDDPLTDADAAAISAAGWPKIEIYYPDYLVTTCPPSGAMDAHVDVTSTQSVIDMMESFDFSGSFSEITVSGVTTSWVYVTKESSDFASLKGGTLYGYKYIPLAECLIALDEVYMNGNCIEFFDPQRADGDPNGIYVFTNSQVDQTVTKTPEEAVELVEIAQVKAEEEAASIAAEEEARREEEQQSAMNETAAAEPVENADVLVADEDEKTSPIPVPVVVTVGGIVIAGGGGAAFYLLKIRKLK